MQLCRSFTQILPIYFCNLNIWLFLFWPYTTSKSSVCKNFRAQSMSLTVTFSTSVQFLEYSVKKFQTLVALEYLERLAFISSLACSAILVSLILVVAVLPVVMMSISIRPVWGSVAACWVATFIRLIAYSTSPKTTSFESLIFAKASLSLIRD